MCGRYSFAPKPKQRATLPETDNPTEHLKISFNIAPTQAAYVVANDQPHLLQRMSWGLVPYWSKDGKNSGKLINARAEGIDEKPSFRTPIQSRRCWVPADSFYEWRTLPGGRKVPYRIFPEDGSLLCMAGIWDEWRHGTEIKRTFSVLTTTPNREMSTLHNRMPVVLQSEGDRRLWLSDVPLSSVLDMLHPPADGTFGMYPVSDKVNKAGNDGPELQEPVAIETGLLF